MEIINHKFSKKEAIKFGWKTVMDNFGFFILMMFVVFGIQIVQNILENRKIEEAIGGPAIVLISIAYIFISILVSIGETKIALDFSNNRKGQIKDLFTGINYFIKYFLSALLYGLIVLLGMILLIIPGIIFGIKYQFFSYLIIDKGLGPIEAIKKSGEITRGEKWNLFLFGLLLLLINFAGVLCLFVGLFVTVPLSMLAMAYVYKKLADTAITTEVKESQPAIINS